jgi:hypothetical protein
MLESDWRIPLPKDKGDRGDLSTQISPVDPYRSTRSFAPKSQGARHKGSSTETLKITVVEGEASHLELPKEPDKKSQTQDEA